MLSPRTRGVLGAADIGLMKRGAILVNTSRAPLVDEAALIDAAGDGASSRPSTSTSASRFRRHPLLSCPNTVLTPHLGYSVLEVYRVFYAQCVENALAYLEGAPIRLLPVDA